VRPKFGVLRAKGQSGWPRIRGSGSGGHGGRTARQAGPERFRQPSRGEDVAQRELTLDHRDDAQPAMSPERGAFPDPASSAAQDSGSSRFAALVVLRRARYTPATPTRHRLGKRSEPREVSVPCGAQELGIEVDARNPPLSHLLITPSGPPPSRADLTALMARLGLDQAWSDAAVEQLIRAAAAADRWLADHPEEAPRLVEDPVGAVEAMRRLGLLTEPVDELLDVLKALGRHAVAKRTPHPVLDRATVRFGATPALRVRPQPPDRTEDQQAGRRVRRTPRR
jgi:hypothetical protein